MPHEKIEKKLIENIPEERMESVPELMASIKELIERVNDTDNEMVRLTRQTDQRLSGRELKGNSLQTWGISFYQSHLKKTRFSILILFFFEFCRRINMS